MKDICSLADFAVRFGAEMIRCGGEVSRAEDSVSRICAAYGAVRCDVFAINSYISVCVKLPEEEPRMLSARIKGRYTDMQRLEQLNGVSRQICNGETDLNEAEKILSGVLPKRSVLGVCVCSMLVCAVFTLYFGGGAADAVIAGFAAVVIVYLKRKAKNGFGNAVVFTFISSFLCGMVGASLSLFSNGLSYSMIAKGDIMLLVPGVSIVCSGRDIICGELLTGLLGFIETILIAVALAAGFAVPELILEAVRGK